MRLMSGMLKTVKCVINSKGYENMDSQNHKTVFMSDYMKLMRKYANLIGKWIFDM